MGEYKLTFLYKRGLDHKTRNVIVLFVILVLIVVIAILIGNKMKANREELLAHNAELQLELSNIMAELATEESLREQLAELKEEQFLSDKLMPDYNNTTITLSYIFDIFQKYSTNFHFNYRLVNTGEVEGDEDVHFIRYNMTGQAYINLLYVFLDQLERQPAFYTIETIELGTQPPEERGKVSFNIDFKAYYANDGAVPHEDVALKNLRERRLVYNIFYPRIHQPMDSEELREKLDISEIMVVGMTQERIFIRNRRTGNIQVMYPGDEIRYGSLIEIDWINQEVVFRISPTGLAEEIRLQIEAQ